MSKKSGERDLQLLGLLTELNKPLEKLVVKLSPILSKLETVLFNPASNFKEGDYKMLFVGIPSQKLKGLFHICSLKSKGFKNEPKKGARYALKIIKRLLYESHQKDIVSSVFLDLENEELKLMRLGFHIISDNKNDSAYYISKINYVLSIKRINPKEKRKFLDLEYYIENSQSQKKFLQWIQAQNQEIKASSKHEDDQSERSTNDGEGPGKIFQMIYRRKKSENEFDGVRIIRNHEYFINTFKDPLLDSKLTDKEKEALKAKGKKKDVSFLDDDENNKYDEIIELIHIESDQFDPVALLENIHAMTPRLNILKSVKFVEKDITSQTIKKQKLFFVNINDISKQEVKLKNLKDQVFALEGDPATGRTSEIKQKLLQFNENLNQISEKFHEMNKTKSDMKSCLKIINRFYHYINWPKKMETHIIKGDYKSLIAEYNEKSKILQDLKELPIFKEISQNIGTMIEEFHNTILNNISIREDRVISLKESIHHLFITNYARPIDSVLDRILKEAKEYIMGYFNPTFSFEIEETNTNLDFFERRLSLNSLKDLVSKLNTEDEIFAEAQEQNLKISDEPSIFSAHTSSQIRNFDKFIKIILGIMDNYFDLIESIKAGEFRKYFKLSSKQFAKYDESAINKCELNYDIILKLLIANIRSFVNKNAALTHVSSTISNKIIQSDLYTIGKWIATLDRILVSKSIRRKDIKDLRTRIVELIFNHSHRYFLKETIERIDYENNCMLVQDFYGLFHSKFMKKFKDGFEENLKEIKMIISIIDRESEKTELLIEYLSNIFQDFITEIKQKMMVDFNAEDHSTNLMITLANITYLSEEYCTLIGEIYCDELQVINRVKFLEKLETNNKFFFYSQIKEMKLLYLKKRRTEIVEIVDHYLLSPNLKSFEGRFLETYRKLTLENSLISEIRFYIFEILTLLVYAYEELLFQAKQYLPDILKLIIDEVASVLVTTSKKILENTKDVKEYQQFWHEVEFFLNVTTKYQSPRCIANLQNIYDDLKEERSNIENTPLYKTELFDEEDARKHKVLIITAKLKFYRQFEVLFG